MYTLPPETGPVACAGRRGGAGRRAGPPRPPMAPVPGAAGGAHARRDAGHGAGPVPGRGLGHAEDERAAGGASGGAARAVPRGSARLQRGTGAPAGMTVSRLQVCICVRSCPGPGPGPRPGPDMLASLWHWRKNNPVSEYAPRPPALLPTVSPAQPRKCCVTPPTRNFMLNPGCARHDGPRLGRVTLAARHMDFSRYPPYDPPYADGPVLHCSPRCICSRLRWRTACAIRTS